MTQGLVTLRWDGCCETSNRTRTTSCDLQPARLSRARRSRPAFWRSTATNPTARAAAPMKRERGYRKTQIRNTPNPLEQTQLHRGLVPQMTLDGTIPVLPSPSHHAMIPAPAARITPPGPQTSGHDRPVTRTAPFTRHSFLSTREEMIAKPNPNSARRTALQFADSTSMPCFIQVICLLFVR